ncbi:unnamed protein product [Boreogadus saida]
MVSCLGGGGSLNVPACHIWWRMRATRPSYGPFWVGAPTSSHPQSRPSRSRSRRGRSRRSRDDAARDDAARDGDEAAGHEVAGDEVAGDGAAGDELRETRPRNEPRRQQKQPCCAPDRRPSERPPEASAKGGGVWQPGPGQLRILRVPEEQVEKRCLNSLLLHSFGALPAVELLHGDTGPYNSIKKTDDGFKAVQVQGTAIVD